MQHNLTLYKGAWYNIKSPHISKQLSKNEIRQIMNKGGMFIRNTYDFDCSDETSFWYIIQDKFIDIAEFTSKNTRQQIRKSLSTYRFEKVSADVMHEKAYKVYIETLMRYGVDLKTATSEEDFHKYIDRLDRKNDEFWMGFCIEDGNAAMFEIVEVFDDYVNEASEKLSVNYTKNSPTLGLNYVLTEYYINKLGKKYILAGSRSITEHSNVQNFLIDKLKFRKAYCRLQIEYKWWLKIAMNILYPFRKLISVPKVKALLNMEAMKRGAY